MRHPTGWTLAAADAQPWVDAPVHKLFNVSGTASAHTTFVELLIISARSQPGRSPLPLLPTLLLLPLPITLPLLLPKPCRPSQYPSGFL
jgi:hypothetical protein